jgi:predicted nucleic acid-binding protein
MVGAGLVALDTAPFIYFVGRHPEFIAQVRSLFAAMAARQGEFVTSALTWSEVLVVPYRAGNETLAAFCSGLWCRRGRLLSLTSWPCT